LHMAKFLPGSDLPVRFVTTSIGFARRSHFSTRSQGLGRPPQSFAGRSGFSFRGQGHICDYRGIDAILSAPTIEPARVFSREHVLAPLSHQPGHDAVLNVNFLAEVEHALAAFKGIHDSPRSEPDEINGPNTATCRWNA
jgi:hypothetical protein